MQHASAYVTLDMMYDKHKTSTINKNFDIRVFQSSALILFTQYRPKNRIQQRCIDYLNLCERVTNVTIMKQCKAVCIYFTPFYLSI